MSRRTLSAEERDLWNSVAKQAKPLKKSRKTAVTVPSPLAGAGRAEVARSKPGEGALARPPHPPSLVSKAHLPSPTRGEGANKTVAPSLSHFDRRERAKIARGQREIDARIDLHGMTQARAHRALLAFLQREAGDGARLALVITGKGKATSADSSRGVLRRVVPEWLALPEFRALVVSFEQAAIGHGGEGALYVRIRRGR